MEFRRKITFFFWYIYYLTVSKDEYCALSALWRRYREYCRGALFYFAPCHDLWKMEPSSLGQCKASSLLCHALRYDFNVVSSLTLFDLISHHARRRCRHFEDIWSFPTLPLPRRPCAVLIPPSVIINVRLVQSVTVSEFQDNWQVLVSQVWRACLCCRNHWTVKLSKWITPGSTDRELSVQWDGRWRSNRKSCIHRIMEETPGTRNAGSMLEI